MSKVDFPCLAVGLAMNGPFKGGWWQLGLTYRDALPVRQFTLTESSEPASVATAAMDGASPTFVYLRDAYFSIDVGGTLVWVIMYRTDGDTKTCEELMADIEKEVNDMVTTGIPNRLDGIAEMILATKGINARTNEEIN